MEQPWMLLFCAAGLFSIFGGVCDWDWFMHHHKSKLIVKLVGHGGARVFYVLLGVGICVLGVLLAMGVVD